MVTSYVQILSFCHTHVFTCIELILMLIEMYLLFIPRHLKKCGVLCYTLQKICVRVSVRLSVCLSVRQRFISGLYLEHLLTDFLQTLYRSLYQEGVVWD